MKSYQCGTCASPDLVVIPTPTGWKVTCGTGHELVPIPGHVITVRGAVAGGRPALAVQ